MEIKVKKKKIEVKFCKKCGEYITKDGSCSNPFCPLRPEDYNDDTIV